MTEYLKLFINLNQSLLRRSNIEIDLNFYIIKQVVLDKLNNSVKLLAKEILKAQQNNNKNTIQNQLEKIYDENRENMKEEIDTHKSTTTKINKFQDNIYDKYKDISSHQRKEIDELAKKGKSIKEISKELKLNCSKIHHLQYRSIVDKPIDTSLTRSRKCVNQKYDGEQRRKINVCYLRQSNIIKNKNQSDSFKLILSQEEKHQIQETLTKKNSLVSYKELQNSMQEKFIERKYDYEGFLKWLIRYSVRSNAECLKYNFYCVKLEGKQYFTTNLNFYHQAKVPNKSNKLKKKQFPINLE